MIIYPFSLKKPSQEAKETPPIPSPKKNPFSLIKKDLLKQLCRYSIICLLGIWIGFCIGRARTGVKQKAIRALPSRPTSHSRTLSPKDAAKKACEQFIHFQETWKDWVHLKENINKRVRQSKRDQKASSEVIEWRKEKEKLLLSLKTSLDAFFALLIPHIEEQKKRIAQCQKSQLRQSPKESILASPTAMLYYLSYPDKYLSIIGGGVKKHRMQKQQNLSEFRRMKKELNRKDAELSPKQLETEQVIISGILAKTLLKK